MTHPADRPFAKYQPKDGETVLHCGHLENKPHHFFAMSDPSKEIQPLVFQRPDGTTGRATWMVLCSQCFPKFCDCPDKAMRADAKWIGDEPALRENFQ